MALITDHGLEETERIFDTQPLLGSQSSRESLQDNLSRMSSSTPKLLPQYIAALFATIGALAMGTIMGYSSPAGVILTSNTTDSNIHLTDFQNSWFSSISNLGSAIGCPLAGMSINYFGRRGTMILSVIPVLIGWILIAAAQNFAMLILGRIVTGVYGSFISLTVNTFIAEISSPNIRGTLGTGFQLMLTVGIMFVYILGVPFSSFRWIAGICLIIPCICSALMFFTKESPIYLLSKGKDQEAEEALKFFRGQDYEGIGSEMQELRDSLEESKRKKVTLSDLKKPYILKPFLISIGLMFFQQFSGINAVLFNLSIIFEDAGSQLSPALSSIIVGLMQVIATFASALLIDKAGRKILLIISSGIMTIALVALGLFFYLLKYSPDVAENLHWLPLVSLIVFIIAFSLGLGPIPWVMMGELFSPEIKEISASIATLLNWSCAFITTLIFHPLQHVLQDYGVYWMFSCFCLASAIFSIAFVYETKGKSLQEISAHFGAPQHTSEPVKKTPE